MRRRMLLPAVLTLSLFCLAPAARAGEIGGRLRLAVATALVDYQVEHTSWGDSHNVTTGLTGGMPRFGVGYAITDDLVFTGMFSLLYEYHSGGLWRGSLAPSLEYCFLDGPIRPFAAVEASGNLLYGRSWWYTVGFFLGGGGGMHAFFHDDRISLDLSAVIGCSFDHKVAEMSRSDYRTLIAQLRLGLSFWLLQRPKPKAN